MKKNICLFHHSIYYSGQLVIGCVKVIEIILKLCLIDFVKQDLIMTWEMILHKKFEDVNRKLRKNIGKKNKLVKTVLVSRLYEKI